MFNFQQLQALGWQPFYQQQLTLEEWDSVKPVRVSTIHKSQIQVLWQNDHLVLDVRPNWPPLAVGDWLLLDTENQLIRILTRKSEIKRRAPGNQRSEQLIASNLDYLIVVCALNHDFNLNRLERYLSLANQNDIEPVVVLTRADECDNVARFVQQVEELGNLLSVVAINALKSTCQETLQPWLGTGKTLAVMGSSGAGKSTLINSLMGDSLQQTQAVREDDSKGRHTTTARSLHRLPTGALIIDTPGMRELKLTDVHDGIESTFEDINQLAQHCRFKNCQHLSEPGCAVLEAIDRGDLEQRRLESYRKLIREDQFNSKTLAQRRHDDKQFGKMVRNVMDHKKLNKGR